MKARRARCCSSFSRPWPPAAPVCSYGRAQPPRPHLRYKSCWLLASPARGSRGPEAPETPALPTPAVRLSANEPACVCLCLRVCVLRVRVEPPSPSPPPSCVAGWLQHGRLVGESAHCIGRSLFVLSRQGFSWNGHSQPVPRRTWADKWLCSLLAAVGHTEKSLRVPGWKLKGPHPPSVQTYWCAFPRRFALCFYARRALRFALPRAGSFPPIHARTHLPMGGSLRASTSPPWSALLRVHGAGRHDVGLCLSPSQRSIPIEKQSRC